MPLLQTLESHEVITTQAVDIQRASLKRQVRDVAGAARNLAMGLRRRMNAMGGREGGAGSVGADAPDDEAHEVASTELGADSVPETAHSADAVSEAAHASECQQS
jgi:hypothetical protein